MQEALAGAGSHQGFFRGDDGNRTRVISLEDSPQASSDSRRLAPTGTVACCDSPLHQVFLDFLRVHLG